MSTTQPLTAADEADVTAQERRADLLATPSEWHAMSEGYMRHLMQRGTHRPEPSIFRRDDGAALVYPGRTHIFMGEPESYKTWAALFMIAQEIKAGNAGLLIDCEDEAATAIERLQQLGLSQDEIAEGFRYISPSGTRFDAVARAYVENVFAVCDHMITVAVIDSMTEAMTLNGWDPDKGTDVSSFYHSLPHTLTDQGAAVVIIDHVTKTSSTRGRWAIGSERKVSGLTGAAYVFKARRPFGRGMTGTVGITMSKDRCGSVRPLARGSDESLGTLTLASDETGAVEVTFRIPGGNAAADASEAFAETVNRIRQETWDVIDASPGITSAALRRAGGPPSPASSPGDRHCRRRLRPRPVTGDLESPESGYPDPAGGPVRNSIRRSAHAADGLKVLPGFPM